MHNTTTRRMRRFGLITATAAGFAGAALAMSASASAEDISRRPAPAGITASGDLAEGKKVGLGKPEQLIDLAENKKKAELPKMDFGKPAELLPDLAQASFAEKLANNPDSKPKP